MKYVFEAAYELVGLLAPDGAAVVQEREVGGLRVVITANGNNALLDLDRMSAVRSLGLSRIESAKDEGVVRETIEQRLSEIQTARRQRLGQSLVVAFHAEGDVDEWDIKTRREFPGFVVLLPGPRKESIRQVHQKQIDRILAALAIAVPQISGYRKVADGVFFRDQEGRPVYAWRVSAVGRITVSTTANLAQLEKANELTERLLGDSEFEKCFTLLKKSLDEDSEQLLSFVSAWAGLEIFVSKAFKKYESMVFDSFAGESVSVHWMNRIREVMRDKYRLTDKFSLICRLLLGHGAEADELEFGRLKDLRDSLLHGDEVMLSAHDAVNTQQLLRKYLRLHLDRKSAGQIDR